jgi:hypothetical protein
MMLELERIMLVVATRYLGVIRIKVAPEGKGRKGRSACEMG